MLVWLARLAFCCLFHCSYQSQMVTWCYPLPHVQRCGACWLEAPQSRYQHLPDPCQLLPRFQLAYIRKFPPNHHCVRDQQLDSFIPQISSIGDSLKGICDDLLLCRSPVWCSAPFSLRQEWSSRIFVPRRSFCHIIWELFIISVQWFGFLHTFDPAANFGTRTAICLLFITRWVKTRTHSYMYCIYIS